METFSTVLFIHDLPVGYTVYKNKDKISLAPAKNSHRAIIAPQLLAVQKDGGWQISGTENPDLIAQVLEVVVGAGKNIPHNSLSAAL